MLPQAVAQAGQQGAPVGRRRRVGRRDDHLLTMQTNTSLAAATALTMLCSPASTPAGRTSRHQSRSDALDSTHACSIIIVYSASS